MRNHNSDPSKQRSTLCTCRPNDHFGSAKEERPQRGESDQLRQCTQTNREPDNYQHGSEHQHNIIPAATTEPGHNFPRREKPPTCRVMGRYNVNVKIKAYALKSNNVVYLMTHLWVLQEGYTEFSFGVQVQKTYLFTV